MLASPMHHSNLQNKFRVTAAICYSFTHRTEKIAFIAGFHFTALRSQIHGVHF